MTSVVLDTNIYDKIVEHGMIDDLVRLVEAKRLRILTTHIQRDELARIPDVGKREAALRVPGELVPTAGAVLGVSRFGEARLGEGTADGIDIPAIQKGNPAHSQDALIAVTAATEGCILVTEDVGFAKKVRARTSKTQVWDFVTFAAHVAVLLRGLR